MRLVHTREHANPHRASPSQQSEKHNPVIMHSTHQATQTTHLRLIIPLPLPLIRIHVKLPKNHKILHHRAQRPKQPRQRVEQIRPVLLKRNKTRAVRKVPRKRQQEKQQREPLARLFPVILDNLRDARAEVAHGAKVAQRETNLLPGAVRRGGGTRARTGVAVGSVPRAGLVGEEPARRADEVYREDAQCVVEPGVAVGCLVLAGDHLAQGVERALLVVGVTALRAGEAGRRGRATAAGGSRKKGLIFPCFGRACAGGGNGRGGAAAGGCAAGVLGVVVDALGD